MNDDETVAGGDRRVLAAHVLTAVLDALEAIPDSPRTRKLRAHARSYESTIKAWATIKPADAQVAAMLELMTELLTKVTEEKNRVSSV